MKASSADAATSADSVRLVLIIIAWSLLVELLTGNSCEDICLPSGPAEMQGAVTQAFSTVIRLKVQSSPEQLPRETCI